MTRLSVDYAGLVRGLRMPLAPAELGAALLDTVAERYEHQFPVCSMNAVICACGRVSLEAPKRNRVPAAPIR
jgi:hypothetical protein